MKKIVFVILLAISQVVQAQEACVTCKDNIVEGDHASAIGYGSMAIGGASFAAGLHVTTNGHYSLGIGSYIEANGVGSMVIGSGVASLHRLINPNANSLMIGFSDKPTLYVGPSGGLGTTGRIGIGNTGIPHAKLHLKADNQEIAAMFIEPDVWDDGSVPGGGGGGIEIKSLGILTLNTTGAYLLLGNINHGIGATRNLGLIFSTESNYIFKEGNVGINTISPRYDMHIEGSLFTKEFTLIDDQNIPQKGFVLVSDDVGKGWWTDPKEYGLWKINPNNGVDLYYPEGIEGNVGIGTINTFGYRLAVNGKILTDEVMVMDPVNWTWPDHISNSEDGGYIIIGHTKSDDGDVIGNHKYDRADIWIVKTDSVGEIEWQHCFGGIGNERFYGLHGVLKKNDYNYVLAPITEGNSGDVVCDGEHTRGWIFEIKDCHHYAPAQPQQPTGNDTLCVNTDSITTYTTTQVTNAWYYEWELQPEEAGTTLNDSITTTVNWNPNYEGPATLKVRSSNDCGESAWSDSLVIQTYMCLGTEENNPTNNLRVYPNPATSMLIVEMENNAIKSYNIEVYNSFGSKVYSVKAVNNNTSINVSGWKSGIYVVKIISGSRSFNRKVIVK